MVDISTYLSADSSIFDHIFRDQTAEINNRLNQTGESITLIRGTAPITVQVVVSAFAPQSSEQDNTSGGMSSRLSLLMVGLPTLDVRKGDAFKYGGIGYTVVLVSRANRGQTDAYCEGNQ
jgi:hypothetical protein